VQKETFVRGEVTMNIKVNNQMAWGWHHAELTAGPWVGGTGGKRKEGFLQIVQSRQKTFLQERLCPKFFKL